MLHIFKKISDDLDFSFDLIDISGYGIDALFCFCSKYIYEVY